MGARRSVELNQSLEEGQKPSFTGLCERRGSRGSAPIREAPDSVRGPIRVQYPSRVNGNRYGEWLKA